MFECNINNDDRSNYRNIYQNNKLANIDEIKTDSKFEDITYDMEEDISQDDVFKTYGITATVGIWTNMYLTKIALDITAKHSATNIGYLDEEKYKKEVSVKLM